MYGRTIITLTGVSKRVTKNTSVQKTNRNRTDLDKRTDEYPPRLCRIPSINATLPNKYPQNEVSERQKKHPQDSMALAEIVPAPPRTRLIEVTMNSATVYQLVAT